MSLEQENSGIKDFAVSEKGVFSLLRDTDLSVYAPGISSAGRVEVEMANRNSERTIIGTTIDENGYRVTDKLIRDLGLQDQIEVKLEDLREKNNYPDESFDLIYARLVLHYLSAQDLDFVLEDFYRVLRPNGRLYVVVRSDENIPEDKEVMYDEKTKLTTIVHPGGSQEIRYFHSSKSIVKHIREAGFVLQDLDEYAEYLYIDFERKKRAPHVDHLIEVCAYKE